MKKTDMKKVRELLHLVIVQGHSSRHAAKVVGMSKSCASEYVSGFKSSGIELDQISKLSDIELLSVITGPNGKQANERYADLVSLFGYIEKELLRPGVTLQLLWQELFAEHPKSYSYSQFCFHYQQWAKKQKVGMHMEHKAGDKLYVDFTGVKQTIIDAATGEIREVEVFVGVLGGSQKAYIEAVESQKKVTTQVLFFLKKHT